MNRPASLCSASALLVIGFAHVIRLFAGVQITINGFAVPVWASAPVAVLLAGLGFWLLKERRTASA
jgi:lipopolysaccharide export LptBFGC system permease protein LptF